MWDLAIGAEVAVVRLLETKTVKFIRKADKSKDEKAVCTQIFVDMREHKAVKERVQLNVGGDQIHYQGEVSIKTVELPTCKMNFNGVVSTPGVRFMGMDLKEIYLDTPL